MVTRMSPFTDDELDYLRSQLLGRLATVGPGGAPQNKPVHFRYNAELGTVDVFGLNMDATQKYRNVRSRPEVALVIDDIVSLNPWSARGIEIRGQAEALDGQAQPRGGMSRATIRIHPRRIISWGVRRDQAGMHARDVVEAGSVLRLA